MFGQALLGLPPLAAAFFGAGPATVSIVFMTFAMYRGPIWVLQGVMARLLPVFVDRVEKEDHRQLREWMHRLALGGLLFATLGLALGLLFGPTILAWLIGEGFRPDPVFSGLTAAGVVLAACAGLMNQVLLAIDRLPDVTYSWLIGFLVAVIVALMMTVSPALRVGSGFLAGAVIALAGLYTRFIRGGLPVAAAPPAVATEVDPDVRP